MQLVSKRCSSSCYLHLLTQSLIHPTFSRRDLKASRSGVRLFAISVPFHRATDECTVPCMDDWFYICMYVFLCVPENVQRKDDDRSLRIVSLCHFRLCATSFFRWDFQFAPFWNIYSYLGLEDLETAMWCACGANLITRLHLFLHFFPINLFRTLRVFFFFFFLTFIGSLTNTVL